MAIETTPSTAMMLTLPRDAYLSAEHFAREAERIFHRGWFFVGRQESIPVAGDYLHVEVAGESVLIVRSRSGGLSAFYNVCRHRGSRLVMEDPCADGGDGGSASGHFKGSIRCPYHAWTYGLEGQLRNAPFLTESDGLRREQLSLHPVAVDMWAGFVFVNLTPSELTPDRSLSAQLADTIERTRNYPLADLRVGRRITYDVDANWKTIVENYNECYHCGPVHPELCELVPAFKQDGGRELDWDTGVPHREGATTFTFTGTTTREPFPGLSEGERVRHKGELIYPNLMLSLSADHVVAFTLWPEDAGHTRIGCDFLFHPAEMAKPGFDPADAADFWDLVNRQDWQICESVQKGMSSRAFSFGYYAPMEDLSLDIRRYLADTVGDLPEACP
jgi:Rieske 2Fe-2S family protein